MVAGDDVSNFGIGAGGAAAVLVMGAIGVGAGGSA